MMEDSKIGGLQGLQGARELEIRKSKSQDPNAPKFDEMLSSFVKDVNGLQLNADKSIQKMVSGEIKDVHQVMLAVGEAKVAFNLMLEIRNKTMEAYQELSKMRG
jgi:flagellar hook-basal body complex protein FliE|tara:strand:+ start:1801 stop:2112 length:312 start_codon:yes stop_codon:yes gene_type:complete